MRVIYLVLSLWTLAAAYNGGFHDCPSSFVGTPGHGSFGSGTPPFALRLKCLGVIQTEWSADYSNGCLLELYPTTAAPFKGFVLAPFFGSNPSAFTDGKMGDLTTLNGNAQSMSSCGNGLTHVSGTSKTLVQAKWVPPDYGSGTVTFWAVVVQCQLCGLPNFHVKLTLPEAGAAPEEPSVTATNSETPQGTPSASRTVSAAASVGPTLSGTGSRSASSTASFSRSATNTISGTVTGSQSGTKTGTLSQSGTASPSSSQSRSGSSTGTRSGTSSAAPTLSITPSAPLTPSATISTGASNYPTVSSTTSPSITASPTGTLSPTGTGTTTASSTTTGTPSGSITMTVTPTAAVTLTGTATASASVSGTSSASGSFSGTTTPSHTSSPTVSVSFSPTGALTPAATASATPTSVVPAVYPSATAVTSRMTVRWSLDDPNTPSEVNFRVEVQGHAWVAVGRSDGTVMLNSVVTGRPGSGPVVVGEPASGFVQQYILATTTQTGINMVDASLVTIGPMALSFDIASNVTAMSFTRLLVASGHASEKAIDPRAPATFIYAYGNSGVTSVGDHGVNRGSFDLQLIPGTCTAAGTCNSNGRCPTAASTTCICELGYAGATCATCDIGYARAGAGGACAPIDATAVVASVQISLWASAGTAGSPARQQFITQLTQDLAFALNVSTLRLNVTAVVPGTGAWDGSVLATVQIQIPAVVAGQPGTSGLTNPSTQELALSLLSQREDPSSRLFQGVLTQWMDASAPMDFALSAPPIYAFTVKLADALTFQYSIAGGTLIGQLTFTGGATRWFALGFNSDTQMPGADAIVYEPGGVPSAVSQVTINDRTASGVMKVSASSQMLTSERTIVSGGVVTLQFARSIAAGAYTGAIAIPATGSGALIYAFGAVGDTTMGRHALKDAGAGVLQYSSGAFTLVNVRASAAKIAHGAIMVIAWGVLIPVGVMIARFTKGVAPSTGPSAFWFKRHWMVQVVGLVLGLSAFAIAVAVVQSGLHFTDPHHILGLVVTLAGIMQPLYARFRPAKAAAGEKTSCGRRVWELVHKGMGYAAVLLAVPTIFLGLVLIDAPAGYFAGYALVLLLLIAVFVWRQCASRVVSYPSKVLSARPTPVFAASEHGAVRTSVFEMVQTATPMRDSTVMPAMGRIRSWRSGSGDKSPIGAHIDGALKVAFPAAPLSTPNPNSTVMVAPRALPVPPSPGQVHVRLSSRRTATPDGSSRRQ